MLKYIFAAVLLSVTPIFAGAPTASAVPGQCINTPWGGFCDSLPMADGSFQHFEWAMGFYNCYQACIGADGRPYPTDLNWNTPC